MNTPNKDGVIITSDVMEDIPNDIKSSYKNTEQTTADIQEALTTCHLRPAERKEFEQLKNDIMIFKNYLTPAVAER
eukprot:3145395-Heterocapsa_arctica.AAC.1